MRGNFVIGCEDSLRNEVAGISRTAGAVVVSSIIYKGLLNGRDLNGAGKSILRYVHDRFKLKLATRNVGILTGKRQGFAEVLTRRKVNICYMQI